MTNNLSQATFNIVGPVTLSGEGASLILTNAPPGQYIVTWGAVPYWNSPVTKTNSVVALGTSYFKGDYSLTDTNGNGIADSWERAYFGSASVSHPGTTDTDHDGMTDLAEFIAGTNPTNAASVLHFFHPVVQNTGAVRLDWPAVPGRSYRLTTSGSSLTDWVPATDWTRANGTVLSFTTNVLNGTRFYRLEVKP